MTQPWYQFSLRSLMLLVLFVAVLCSLGVCTHWLLSVVLGSTVLVGGIAGRIVAGTGLGFVQGFVFALQFVLVLLLACIFLIFAFRPTVILESPWPLCATFAVASLLGGICGGYTVRPRR
jgi:hypothetical protein